MNIQIRELKKINGKEIVQITTLGERWYKCLRTLTFKPSSTWIASYYPKGIAYYKWLAEMGWDEAEAIKREAGERGSKVHQLIDKLIKGEKLRMDTKITNPTTLQEEEPTPDEWECVMTFKSWWDEQLKSADFKIIANEVVVEGENYCGTLDLLYFKDGKMHLLDIKTNPNIWKSSELQLASYKHALELLNEKVDVIEILQVGYKRNKNGWKLTELEDKYDLFQHAYAIWKEENEGVEPKQKDYPIELSLEMPKNKKLVAMKKNARVGTRKVKKTIKRVKKQSK